MYLQVHWLAGSWRGRVAISPRPRGGDWLEDEIKSWRQAGIDVVVTLLTQEEAQELLLSEESHYCEAAGMAFHSLEIPDRGVPPDRLEFLRLLEELEHRLNGGRNIVIHCRQGIGRAGLLACALLVKGGLSAEEAIERVGAARGIPVPETDEQRSWLSQFAKSL